MSANTTPAKPIMRCDIFGCSDFVEVSVSWLVMVSKSSNMVAALFSHSME